MEHALRLFPAPCANNAFDIETAIGLIPRRNFAWPGVEVSTYPAFHVFDMVGRVTE